MAELRAAVALATAVAKLSHFVYGQARVLLDVKDDIEWLMGELSWAESFLKDAENKPDTNHLIQQWVSDVTDLAYNCEDVIDTFLIELRDPNTNVGCLGAMSNCISYTTNLHSTSKLSSQLKKLQRKANNISIRRNRYHLKPDAHSTGGNLMDLRRTTPLYAHDEHMVGQAETIDHLTAELTNGESGRFIISIVGMGGLGKTTLARKLYDKLRQQYFKSCAWICNPQVSDARALLLQLIKSMIKPSKEDLESLDSIDSMESYMHNFLSGCRFLLVIDDLWEMEAWDSLKRAFPYDVNGSKVLITTRNMEVAAMNNVCVHKLRYLNGPESWELFCKKAFPDDNDMIIYDIIKPLGKEMVEKCLGLPLAIVTLGGLLSRKSCTPNEWKLVRDNLWKQLEENTHINALLLLSFRDLPYYLKPCFLYIGMFPENFEIPVSKLILLWVAEGFIGSEMVSLEFVAKSYFNELVGRSLFQKNGEDWIGSTFRVHGLLRDLAIKEAKEIRFSVYYDEEDMFNLTKAAPHKRLASFRPTFASLPSKYTNNPSLRTLFIGSTGVTTRKDLHIHLDDHPFHIRSDEVLRSVHKRFGLLRVLDIQVHYGDDFKPQRLPSKIGSLIHLRYLGFDLLKSAVKELPHSICNLKALQTISVKSDPILPYLTLPKNMGKLQSLRHLIGNFGLGDWIGKLIALETLQEITYEQWCGLSLTIVPRLEASPARNGTRHLFNLRHLSLTNVPRLEASPARFYEKFQTTKNLRTLSLENPEVFELASISVSEIFKCCPRITHFKTSGIKFENSPDLHRVARSLEVLDMVYYKNPEVDPIPLIERLPALRALRMEYYSAYDQMIVCSENGFPRLRTLVIEIDHNVTFSVEEGGMPLLTSLRTKTSHNLKAPQRLMDLIVMF